MSRIVSTMRRPFATPRAAGLRLALTGAIGVAVAVGLSGCGGEAASVGGAAGQDQPPAPVATATARDGELVETWTFVGEVRSLRSAQLALGAGGEVVMIELREGDRVEPGTLLVEIDERQAKARVSAAASSRRESERELEQARREAKRASALGESILPGEEIEQNEVRAESLEARKRRLAAELQAAKAELSDYRLLAPFAGVITARRVDLGQWVDPGETVLELVADDALEILVEVRPELAPQLRVGALATLEPAAGLAGLDESGSPTTAEIVGIVPSLDSGTRTLKVRLEPREPRRWLIPGAPVEVGFPVRYRTGSAGTGSEGTGSEGAATVANRVIVPRDALVLGAVDIRVILVEDDHAKPVLVELEASTADEALIRGPGLRPGVELVTRGNERLRPGQAIRRLDEGAGEADDADGAADAGEAGS